MVATYAIAIGASAIRFECKPATVAASIAVALNVCALNLFRHMTILQLRAT